MPETIYVEDDADLELGESSRHGTKDCHATIGMTRHVYVCLKIVEYVHSEYIQ